MRQSDRDFRHAKHSLNGEDYEWACFAAQQSAGKALKALFQHFGGESWGHSLMKMVKSIPTELNPPEDLMKHAVGLDKVYIPTRHPDSFDSGAPMDYFTREDAETAIEDAEVIVGYAKDCISG
jgi:HEPN domain-containing protein